MPRTGGIFTPPAGTKGTPNTTIQSSPYNAFVDDLTADANEPRPLTAGGHGATNATDARKNLGLEIGTNIQAYDALLQAIAALTTSADGLIYTTGVDTVALTTITSFARSLLDDADETTARQTLGANNANNLNAGTVSDARLPTTMSAKTFSGLVTATADLKVGDGVRVNPTIGIYGPVNTDRVIRAFTNNTVVSELALADFTTQPGGNVGANITFRTYSDAGVFLKNAMTIFRDYGIAAFTSPLRIASYTLLTIPLAGLSAQCIVYVSNGAANKRLAISDGTKWYWPDGTVIS